MRKLTRPDPPEWWDEFAQKGETELREMLGSTTREAIPGGYLSKARFFRDRRSLTNVKNIFAKCSHGTCHVCGVDLLGSFPDIEHYRPKMNARNKRKDRSSPRHYWWLLYDWNNLQLLCPVCNRYKASFFPISEKRAAEESRGSELESEGELLLNAFDDEPIDHLKMQKNGQFAARSERGRTTIEVYQLNRQDLVARRDLLLKKYHPITKARGISVVSSEAIKRDLIDGFLEHAVQSEIGFLPALLDNLIRVSGQSRKSNKANPQADITSTGSKKRVFIDQFKATWIKDVIIRDFGPIEKLNISFPNPSSSQEPWLGIVGENGVGKSSFLKAVTLALVDEKTARQLVSDGSKLKNRNTRRRTGSVEIILSDSRRRKVTVRSNAPDLEFQGDDVDLPVIALGANRITSRRGMARNLPVSSSVNNLFDPVLPLVDTEEWLADTKRVSARDFAVLGENLKALMDLPISTEVTRRHGIIYFKRQSSRLSLEEMSDGFRSVIGLTAHIMKYLAADTPIMSEAEGTVLLDELELHLHPLWKIMIVTRLRELFPRVRFIITTHDPLCLRGLQENETHVFRHNSESGNIEAHRLTIRPGMDVDDLLTGGWFGLGTTYDQDTEDKIHELSALSLKEDALKVRGNDELPIAERAEMEKLSNELSKRLAGFSGSEGEKIMLSQVARSNVDINEEELFDASLLQDRLKKAFKREH